METTDISVIRNEIDPGKESDLESHEEHLIIPRGVEVYEIDGPYFFGIANKFEEQMVQLGDHAQVRIIRMRKVPFIDSTGIHNLTNLCRISQQENTRIILRASIPKYTKSCTKRDSTPCWARKTSARISMRRSDGPKNWLSNRKRNSFPAKQIYPGSAKRVQNKNTVSIGIGKGHVKMRGPDKSGPRIFFTSENNNKQRLFF